MILSFLRIYIGCVSNSTGTCYLTRTLLVFGFLFRYLALLLYAARLRVMAGTQTRVQLNLFSRFFQKIFNALGHSKAVQVVPIIFFSIQAIMTGALVFIFPENLSATGTSVYNFHLYYNKCQRLFLFNWVLPGVCFISTIAIRDQIYQIIKRVIFLVE